MRQRTFLAIDVGNTATSIGVFSIDSRKSNPKPSHVWTIGTDKISQVRFGQFIKTQMHKNQLSTRSIVGGLISSVVPNVDHSIKQVTQKLFGQSFPFVSSKTPTKIKILYKKPSEVGADRIVNARAAISLCSGASIVIDFGTATTFDCVTQNGNYLGGVIAPGPVISAEALYSKTAKLPMVLLSKPADILGRNTLESIQAGLYHGYRGLVKEIVKQLKQRMRGTVHVFATGGQARWILKGIHGVDHYVPHLTLLGLYHFWKDSHAV